MSLKELDEEISNLNSKENDSDDKFQKNEKKYLKEHAHFQYDFTQNLDYLKILFTILNSHNVIPNSSFFSVNSNLKFSEKDNTLELCRRRIYYNYYNNPDYIKNNSKSEICNEKIIINKDKGLIMFIDDDFKKEGILLSKDNIMTKTVKFKKAKNIQELIFLQNIYNYNNIINVSHYINSIYGFSGNKKTLDEFSYHDYLKNLL